MTAFSLKGLRMDATMMTSRIGERKREQTTDFSKGGVG